LELIVIFTVICILFALMIPATIKMQSKQKRIACAGHLKTMSWTFFTFAMDNRDYYPWQVERNVANFRSFNEVVPMIRALSNQLASTAVLSCPADSRKPAADWASLSRASISYFIGLDAMRNGPNSIVAGDRNFTVNGAPVGSGFLNIDTNITAGWDGRMHRFYGMVTVGDGSVQQTSSKFFDQMIHKSATNRFLTP
jgi:hypothetical protein